jgi:hypothetical protein
LEGARRITYAFQASSGARWGATPLMLRCAMMVELPSSSSGPGRRPFKAVARVRIPLGVRQRRQEARSCGAVGVLAALSRRRSRVQVPSGPLKSSRPGSSVGTSVRLKIGRSAVRPRPWPPSLSPGFEHRPPAETRGGRFAVRDPRRLLAVRAATRRRSRPCRGSRLRRRREQGAGRSAPSDQSAYARSRERQRDELYGSQRRPVRGGERPPRSRLEAVTRSIRVDLDALWLSFLGADMSGRAPVRLVQVPTGDVQGARRQDDDIAVARPFDGGLQEQALRAQQVLVQQVGDQFVVRAPVTQRGEAIRVYSATSSSTSPNEPGSCRTTRACWSSTGTAATARPASPRPAPN